MRNTLSAFFILILFLAVSTCQKPLPPKAKELPPRPELLEGRYNVGILVMDGVYNTELTAPYDIFQHTVFRKGIKPMNVFMVANTLDPLPLSKVCAYCQTIITSRLIYQQSTSS